MKFSHNISYMKFVSIPYNDFIYEIFIYEMLCEIFVRELRVIERVLVQFCAFKIGNTIGEFTFVFPESCLS